MLSATFMRQQDTPTLMIHDIACAVARLHEISMSELRGERRDRRAAWPRQICYWVAWNVGRWSSPQIGQYFNRDHTTILYGVQEVERRRSRMSAIKNQTDALLSDFVSFAAKE